jgi:2-polyprenyl-3-methyl-5-hydroxy-6-metoxy-1,4-benzoquinol methylase
MWRRRDVLKRILSPHLSNVDARSILDFGGGQGQLISDLIPGAVPYVYDISEAEPIAGVCKLKSLAECRSHEYGLIICSNVLEHIAFPRNTMREIAGIASPSTLIYLEVPHEHPFRLRTKVHRLIDQLILLARRPRVATSLVGVGMLHLMHEHVNFFSHAALAELTSSSGLQIQASGTYSTGAEMLWTLAQPWQTDGRELAGAV